MGRQNWKEKLVKGPGKKSRRQGDPELPKKLKKTDKIKVESSEALGGRIKQRARKRKLKMALETAVSEEFSKKKKLSQSRKGQVTKKVEKLKKSKSMKAVPKKAVSKEGSNGSSGSKCLDMCTRNRMQ